MAPATEAKKKLQQTRREQGLCIQCGENANGQTRCETCKEKARISRRKSAEKRKAAGLCQVAGCKNPPMQGKTVCKECSRQAGEASLKRYHTRKNDPNETRCLYCNNEAVRRQMCQRCLDRDVVKHREIHKRRVTTGLCAQCGQSKAAEGIQLCEPCNEQRKAWNKDRWERIKLAAFDAYGGPVCAGCGFDDPAVLEIDHIDGGGTQHLKIIGKGNLYNWLKQNNYPEGFRVLCPTCNKLAHKGLLDKEV